MSGGGKGAEGMQAGTMDVLQVQAEGEGALQDRR